MFGALDLCGATPASNSIPALTTQQFYAREGRGAAFGMRGIITISKTLKSTWVLSRSTTKEKGPVAVEPHNMSLHSHYTQVDKHNNLAVQRSQSRSPARYLSLPTASTSLGPREVSCFRSSLIGRERSASQALHMLACFSHVVSCRSTCRARAGDRQRRGSGRRFHARWALIAQIDGRREVSIMNVHRRWMWVMA